MFKYIKIDKLYEESKTKLSKKDIENNDTLFSTELQKIIDSYNNVTEDIIKDLYLLYEEDDEFISNRIMKLIIKEFDLKNINNYEYIEDVHLNNDIIIKLYNSINDNIIIDYICKLSLYYKEVYLVNCFYDNPFNNIFYVVCKNKIGKIDKLRLSKHDYITNINENKQNIYMFLYSCFYSIQYILICYYINRSPGIIRTLDIYKSKYKSFNFIR